MNQTLLSSFGTAFERVEHALDALREGRGVMVLDDEDRENEGDMIFAAETMTVEQMALTIRHGSGIVCLCLTEDRRKQLDLPMMVENNTSAGNIINFLRLSRHMQRRPPRLQQRHPLLGTGHQQRGEIEIGNDFHPALNDLFFILTFTRYRFKL